jgi:hypothetical protein
VTTSYLRSGKKSDQDTNRQHKKRWEGEVINYNSDRRGRGVRGEKKRKHKMQIKINEDSKHEQKKRKAITKKCALKRVGVERDARRELAFG